MVDAPALVVVLGVQALASVASPISAPSGAFGTSAILPRSARGPPERQSRPARVLGTLLR